MFASELARSELAAALFAFTNVGPLKKEMMHFRLKLATAPLKQGNDAYTLRIHTSRSDCYIYMVETMSRIQHYGIP